MVCVFVFCDLAEHITKTLRAHHGGFVAEEVAQAHRASSLLFGWLSVFVFLEFYVVCVCVVCDSDCMCLFRLQSARTYILPDDEPCIVVIHGFALCVDFIC